MRATKQIKADIDAVVACGRKINRQLCGGGREEKMKITICTQYAVILDGYGLHGLTCLLTPANWSRVYSIGRNYTSCGRKLLGWDATHKRLNLWPVSIWFVRQT